jgi:hypothetical protein
MSSISEQDSESQQLLRDLLVLASVPHALVTAIAKDLGGPKQFVSLAKAIGQHLQIPEATTAVARLVSNIEVESVPALTQMVQTWLDAFEGEQKPLTDESFELLKQNLNVLVNPTTAAVIQKTKKATALLTATGNEVTGLTFICDARPVYNEERTDIEGYVPLATMKLYFSRPNEQQDVIELTMSPEEIDAVVDRAQKAREKLNVMQRKFSAWLANGTGEDVQ